MPTRPPSAMLRHWIKRIPGLSWLYPQLRLLFAPKFREDGLATIHNADFLRDARFVAAYGAALEQQPGTWIRWRARVLQWAAVHASMVKGDFVECGVNRGFLSKSVVSYVDFGSRLDRRFYLIDTYRGLVEHLVSEQDRAAYWNEYEEDTYESVRKAFAAQPNVLVIRGVVPDCLPQIGIQQVAYLSIDMNCTPPEIAALEFFWPKLSAGGIVVLDDYGFAGHEAQKRGADDFARRVGVEVLPLPTGQGILLKPPACR